MTHVDQAELSPVRTRPEPVPLPYGLTVDDLLPLFGSGALLGRLTCHGSHRKQGLHGGSNSCIVTLVLVTPSGRKLRQTVFIKATTNSVEREADAYRLLNRAGVRTPELLAVVDRAGVEVIVLEFLPKIGIDFGDRQQVEDLLRQTARLNSVAVAGSRTSAGVMSVDFDRTVERAVGALAEQGLITDREAAHWWLRYQHAQRVVAQMPTALTHGELYFQQVGITERTGSVALFDLATVGVRARLTDVASILKPLAERAGMSELTLFRRYLAELQAGDGTAGSIEWTELQTLRVVTSLWSLPWRISSRHDAHIPGAMRDLTPLINTIRADIDAIR